jgi:hypothetical protein
LDERYNLFGIVFNNKFMNKKEQIMAAKMYAIQSLNNQGDYTQLPVIKAKL